MTDVQLAQLEEVVRTARYNDEMGDDFFYKNLVIVAYEWALRDDAEQAKRLAGSLTETYISTVLPVQMLQSEEFATLVHDLSWYLESRIEVEEGDVEVEKVLLQKPVDGTLN